MKGLPSVPKAVCPTCNGSGKTPTPQGTSYQTCPTCGGTGVVNQQYSPFEFTYATPRTTLPANGSLTPGPMFIQIDTDAVGGFLFDRVTYAITPAGGVSGAVGSAVIDAAGTGYVQGDVLPLTSGGGTGGLVQVTSVSGTGAITGLMVLQQGQGFANTVGATTGAGSISGSTGATVTITILTGNANTANFSVFVQEAGAGSLPYMTPGTNQQGVNIGNWAGSIQLPRYMRVPRLLPPQRKVNFSCFELSGTSYQVEIALQGVKLYEAASSSTASASS